MFEQAGFNCHGQHNKSRPVSHFAGNNDSATTKNNAESTNNKIGLTN